MRQPAYDTPVDEYERNTAERRRRAKRQVKVTAAVAIGLQFLGAGLVLFEMLAHHVPTFLTDLFYRTFGYGNGRYLGAVCWCLSVLATIVCGVLVLVHWSHLSKRWIALGLLPWAVILFEVTLLILALPWNMSGRGG